MSKRTPTKAQVTALSWAIYKCGNEGLMHSLHYDYLDIRDATVAALERAGWVTDAKFYDDAAKWRWHWFRVTEQGRTLPEVVAAVESMRARDAANAARWNAEDADCG
jgi:hypothetical protein